MLNIYKTKETRKKVYLIKEKEARRARTFTSKTKAPKRCGIRSKKIFNA